MDDSNLVISNSKAETGTTTLFFVIVGVEVEKNKVDVLNHSTVSSNLLQQLLF